MKTRKTIALALFAAFVLALGGPVNAAPIAVGNHSFQSPDLSAAGQDIRQIPEGNNDLTPWRVRADAYGGGQMSVFVAENDYGSGSDPDATDGDQYVILSGLGTDAGAGVSGAVYQIGVVPSPLAANTTYTLTFDVGNRDTLNVGDVGATIHAFFTLDATDETATWNANAVGNPFSMTLDDIANGSMLTDQTTTYATGSTDLYHSLNIALKHISTDPDDHAQSRWDNVRLDATPIPEPATMLTVFAGIAGLGRYVNRRRRL